MTRLAIPTRRKKGLTDKILRPLLPRVTVRPSTAFRETPIAQPMLIFSIFARLRYKRLYVIRLAMAKDPPPIRAFGEKGILHRGHYSTKPRGVQVIITNKILKNGKIP